MAFSYRNTLDSALSALPSKFSDQILSEVGDKILITTKLASKYFSFKTTPEVQESLSDHGIDLAPVPFLCHSHPACKMIENHLLYVVLPSLLGNEHSIGLMSLRESKAKKFIKMRRFLKYGEFQAEKMFNASIDAKDLFRYGEPASEASLSSRLNRIKQEYKDGFNARVMLMHDELHFHTPSSIMQLFEEVKVLNSLVCTLICPVELLIGEKKSKNPRIYGFEISGDDLYFFPDGCPSEGYTQPISSSLWPLKTRSISKGSITLRVTVIQTIFAHHLVHIERTDARSSKIKFYKKPSCLLCTELKKLSSEMIPAVIERKTMGSIMLYLSCLKNPNQESALAKLRQLEKRSLFQDEIKVISSIASTFEKVKGWNGLTLSVMEEIKRKFCINYPWLSSFFFEADVWKGLYTAFLSEISVDWFKVSMEDIVLGTFSWNIFKQSNPTEREELAVEDEGPVPIVQVEEEVAVDEEQNESVEQEVEEVTTGEDFLNVPTCDNATRNSVAQCKAERVDEIDIIFKPDSNRKNSCVLRSIAPQLNITTDKLIYTLFSLNLSDNLDTCLDDDLPIGVREIGEIANLLGKNIRCIYQGSELSFGVGEQIFLSLLDGHCEIGKKDKFAIRVVNRPKVQHLGSVDFKVEPDSAIKLAKSFKRGTTGVFIKENEKASQGVDAAEKIANSICEEINANVMYTWGAPGSGKTRGLIEQLKKESEISAIVVSPRRLLSDDWFKALSGTNCKVTTFESFYAINTRRFNCLIIDEISLMPPGSMDLMLSKLVADRVIRPISGTSRSFKITKLRWDSVISSVSICAIGDPMQARYYSENDEILLSRGNDIDRMVLAGANQTLWKTHRMGKWFEKLIDIPCYRTTESDNDSFKIYSGLSAISGRKYDAILCASREDKRDFAGDFPVYTFGESQGMTFNRCLIALTEKIHRVNDYHIFVGLTRSINKFDFILSSDKTVGQFAIGLEKKLLGYILREERIDRSRLANLFKSKPIFVDEERFGANIQQKSGNDPFIQPFCYLGDTIEMEEVQNLDVDEPVPMVKSHLPIVGINPILPDVFDRMRVKEAREAFKYGIGYSDQFIDTDKGLVNSIIGHPMRMEAIFPRHKADDNVTFLMAVKKRLRFSNESEERNELSKVMSDGEELATFLISKLPHKLMICNDDIESAENDFITKRLLKDSAQWENHMNRSDIDWPLDQVFLFMKSQLCTKHEKMFVDAKAGQTLACFQHIVLFKFGPMLRAFEKAFERACGENFYIHNGKNFDKLNSWVKDRCDMLTRGLSVESDYEAFDSSQDALILAFEIAILKKMGVNRNWIADYVNLKVNLGSKIGNFAIMRFTGEFCTFLFNTMANMLFTFLTYDVKKHHCILFAGDDMASMGDIFKNEDGWCVNKLNLFRLKAKVIRQQFPMFCGWKLTPDGIYKLPELLWARINVMNEKGLVKECIDNYLLELKYGYQMSEQLYQYLDERQMEFHYCSVRFFIEKSYLCRGESVKVLKSFGHTFGSTEGTRNRTTWDLNNIRSHLNVERLNGEKFRMLSGSFKGPAAEQVSNVNYFPYPNLWLQEIKRPTTSSFVEIKRKIEFGPSIKNLNIERLNGQKFRDLVKYKAPNLGQGKKLLMKSGDILSYLECQSSKLMRYHSDHLEAISKLMQSILRRSMAMQTFCIQRFSTALEDLSRISRSRLRTQVELFCLNSLSLMMGKLNGSGRKVVSTTMYISVQSLCALAPLYRISRWSAVQLLLLIQQCMSKSRLLSLAMNSISKKDHAHSWLDLPIACRSQTNICKEQCRLQLDSMTSIVILIGRPFQWTSECSIGWPIVQDSFQVDLATLVGTSKKLMEFKDSPLVKIYSMALMHGTKPNLSQLKSTTQRGQEVSFFRRGVVDLGATGLRAYKESIRGKVVMNKVLQTMIQMQELINQRWGNLSHPRLELNHYQQKNSGDMSLKEVMRAEVKARLRRFLWMNFVDPEHELIAAANLPALPAQVIGADNQLIYNSILNHYCYYLFGNIAIIGSSGKVVWPDVEMHIPRIELNTSVIAGQVNPQEVNWETELNLHEVLPRMMQWRESSNIQHIKNGTLRYICEPFAIEAKRFLTERRQNGVTTNLYDKWPKAFEQAPQVAFDFASGLNMIGLSTEERTVIDKMTKRLFRTENQKMVFNAQGEVNISLEG